MPLALNLVSQPDTGYLTTGATDFVSAIDAGQKNMLAKQAAETQNERSAFDLRQLKEKSARDTAISGRLPDLIGAADKAQLTAQNKADLMQYNPELANKIIATNDAKVKENISNFLGSSLLKLAHSTDAESDKTAILDAVNHYGIPLNLSDNPSPEELRNALMVAARGVDALKDTTMTTSSTGERITTTRAGEVTDIKPAEKVKQPVVPALDAKGNEITRPTNLGYGKKVIERKMSDGTWEKLGTAEPPAPRAADEPAPNLTPDAIDAAAERYLIDGTLPPMGMGKGGATGRALILNKAAAMAKERGNGGAAQRIGQLSNKANASTLLQLKKTKTMIKAFEEMANKNADIALEMSDKVDRSGTPVVNRWFLAANNKIAGDVDTATFNTAINVFSNEYAKIMSGSMGNTPVSDSARKEAHEILNTAQTPAQLRANIKLLQREMQNRIKGLDDSERELLKGMGGSSSDTKLAPVNTAIESTGTFVKPKTQQAATIPAGAINMLKSNPGLRTQFDQKYGAGAAAKILGK